MDRMLAHHCCWVLSLFILVLVNAGCGFQVSQSPTPTPTYKPLPTPTPLQNKKIIETFKDSPHASSSLLTSEMANECAYCHNPRSLDPGLSVKQPTTCLTCKQPVPTGQSASLTYMEKTEVKLLGIGCASCHRLENGVVQPGIAWYNPITGTNDTVEDSRGLCTKCHLDQIQVQGLPGSRMAHQDFQCTSCHNPHSVASSCTDSACHPTMADERIILQRLVPPPGHKNLSPNVCSECHIQATAIAGQPELLHMGTMHVKVSCSACHDAADLPVGPSIDENYWDVLMIHQIDESQLKIPVSSHQLHRSVNCMRCHFPSNPWNLKERVSLSDLSKGKAEVNRSQPATPAPTWDSTLRRQ